MPPIVLTAVLTRDLTSYSLSHLLLVNAGNALYSLYVYALAFGPIWALHTFHVSTSLIMLVWCLLFAPSSARGRRRPQRGRVGMVASSLSHASCDLGRRHGGSCKCRPAGHGSAGQSHRAHLRDET